MFLQCWLFPSDKQNAKNQNSRQSPSQLEKYPLQVEMNCCQSNWTLLQTWIDTAGVGLESEEADRKNLRGTKLLIGYVVYQESCPAPLMCSKANLLTLGLSTKKVTGHLHAQKAWIHWWLRGGFESSVRERLQGKDGWLLTRFATPRWSFNHHQSSGSNPPGSTCLYSEVFIWWESGFPKNAS